MKTTSNDLLEKANNCIHALEKHNHKLELEAQRYFDLLMYATQEVSNLYEIINQIELLLEEKGYIDVLEEIDKLKGDDHVR